jgi:hypothetical protein
MRTYVSGLAESNRLTNAPNSVQNPFRLQTQLTTRILMRIQVKKTKRHR